MGLGLTSAPSHSSFLSLSSLLRDSAILQPLASLPFQNPSIVIWNPIR
jgi:hypothetical protein